MLEYQASEEHPLQNVEFDPPPLLHLRLLLPRISRLRPLPKPVHLGYDVNREGNAKDPLVLALRKDIFASVSKNPYTGTRENLLEGSRWGRIVDHRNDDVADIGGLGVTTGLVAEEVRFADDFEISGSSAVFVRRAVQRPPSIRFVVIGSPRNADSHHPAAALYPAPVDPQEVEVAVEADILRVV
ncbi:hypothetical protein BJ322DRAFT_1019823 [Thelephora terrestris]|uniref:Uncharacterized protein n=1 Tax=Thelephora terrestris TaxID=56493 RepID=A0A9P6HIK1_9AGAM|nr:hypothetical protein BJ322DRAFT_1019823 [Thelephora terrestris]